MSYHQVLHIGEDAIQVTVEYRMDFGIYALVDKIIHDGHSIPVGLFDMTQIESIASTLEAGHHEVLRELDWLHAEDKAADRAALNDAYGDYPLGV